MTRKHEDRVARSARAAEITQAPAKALPRAQAHVRAVQGASLNIDVHGGGGDAISAAGVEALLQAPHASRSHSAGGAHVDAGGAYVLNKSGRCKLPWRLCVELM